MFSFARVGAALGMPVEDVLCAAAAPLSAAAEKGGKRHKMSCHHTLENYLRAYLDGCELAGESKGPLFRTIGRGTGRLTAAPLR